MPKVLRAVLAERLMEVILGEAREKHPLGGNAYTNGGSPADEGGGGGRGSSIVAHAAQQDMHYLGNGMRPSQAHAQRARGAGARAGGGGNERFHPSPQDRDLQTHNGRPNPYQVTLYNPFSATLEQEAGVN